MTAHHRPKILLLGDSLTQTSFEGWGSKLSNIYQRRADVINRGYSGYNTSFYLRLPMEPLENTRLVLIFFGANDAALAEHGAHHHVPLADYVANLKILVGRVREQYPLVQDNILFITPPPVQHEQRFVYQKERYGDKATGILERTLENTGLYASACEQLAGELKLPCLNLHKDMQQHQNWARFFYDGLHFSAEGHVCVGDAIVDCINDNFPDFKVEADAKTGQWGNSASKCAALTSDGPFHDEIDHRNPEEAFAKHF